MSKSDQRKPSSSPPCFAEEMDAAYAGYLPAAELIDVLNILLESERAGAKVLARYRKEAPDATAARLLDAVGRDEARYVGLLGRLVEELGGTPSTKTGAFYEKAIAIAPLAERLAFLNRGQAWVARRLAETLPRVRSDAVHAALTEMLATHQANIARCEALLRDHS